MLVGVDQVSEKQVEASWAFFPTGRSRPSCDHINFHWEACLLAQRLPFSYLVLPLVDSWWDLEFHVQLLLKGPVHLASCILGLAPVLHYFSWAVSRAAELTADGGKADPVCPKHRPPGSLSALLPTPVHCRSFLCLKIIDMLQKCVRGAATSDAGNVAVPAPCPRLWCVSPYYPLGSPEVSCRLAGMAAWRCRVWLLD